MCSTLDGLRSLTRGPAEGSGHRLRAHHVAPNSGLEFASVQCGHADKVELCASTLGKQLEFYKFEMRNKGLRIPFSRVPNGSFPFPLLTLVETHFHQSPNCYFHFVVYGISPCDDMSAYEIWRLESKRLSTCKI